MSDRSELVDRCRKIAVEAHRGQFRRDGVTPYVDHCAAVASCFPDDEQARAVAWLHDVIEDTELDADDLRDKGVPDICVTAIIRLTHKNSLPYETYVADLKRDSLARRVKVADIICNMMDDPTPKQVEKYVKALLYLCS